MTPAAYESAHASPQPRPDTLALLFQGVFTAIVRIQTGGQPLGDIDVFRRRMKTLLQEAERDAGIARYSREHIAYAQFAVVALLDEAILSSKDSGRDEWRKKILNVDLFDQANAGDVFFERLQNLMRSEESQRVADVLEVFLLCLLLGFEGRYTGPMRGEALALASRMKLRIESIRGLNYDISPPISLPPAQQAEPPRPAKKADKQWITWLILAGTPILLFLLFDLHLGWRLGQLRELVLK